MNAAPMLKIDHVELFVRDRYAAAAWYQRVLGLEPVPEYQSWATDPLGPLMISGDNGNTKLALFEAKERRSAMGCHVHRIAFRLDARGFCACVRYLSELNLSDEDGRPFNGDSVVDHEQAHSIYFSDPYGNRLEVTTYEYDATCAELDRMRKQITSR